MAHQDNDQDSLLENPSNGMNPMAEMEEDESLDQDYNPPTDEGDGEGDGDDDVDESASLKQPPKDTDAASETDQQRYNEALADALEIRPTIQT